MSLTLIRNPFHTFLSIAGILFILAGCRQDPEPYILEGSGYPYGPGKIILTRCAVEGCHTQLSAPVSGGLSMETWSDLFKGSKNGAMVVPYNDTESPLFHYINTSSPAGPVSFHPETGKPSLTEKEVNTIRNWIIMGAPDTMNNIKFASDTRRKKYYIANQGCDLVTVIDSETELVMRAIPGGKMAAIESPHLIRVSPDGNYWYVIYTNGNLIQKYNAKKDELEGELLLEPGIWNTFAISRDPRYGFVVDWQANGRIYYIDLTTMKVLNKWQGSNLFLFPHGIAEHPLHKTVYVTSQSQNLLYKITYTNPASPDVEEVDLGPLTNGVIPEPHEILFSRDGKEFYVSCQKTNEIRVYSGENDSLLRIVGTGGYPQEMALSRDGILGVTCSADINAMGTGSVTLINTKTGTVINVLTGGQPHGIAIDDAKRVAVVAFRNIDVSGPPPHHSSSCGGRNGFLRYIHIDTGKILEKRTELSVDPYTVAIRD